MKDTSYRPKQLMQSTQISQVAQALSQTDRQEYCDGPLGQIDLTVTLNGLVSVGVQGESSVEEVSVSQDTVFNTQVLHCVVNGIGVR
eukprot:1303023-Amorphochlora_amoeboformis.AAC.1